MAKRKIDFRGPFQGLVTSQDASRLSPGQASDANNVYTSDGSIRSRMGYDLLNSTVPAYTSFDNFLRDNSTTLGTLTSGDTWVTNDDNSGTLNELAIYNGRARGSNDITQHCSNTLAAANGTDNPLSLGDQTIEFLLRKHQGMGTVANSFSVTDSGDSSKASETSCSLQVHFRADSVDNILDEATNNDYLVRFTIPCGPYDNDGVWDDLSVAVRKTTNGTEAAVGAAHSGTDDAPGVDEWIPVKIVVANNGSDVDINVTVNGIEILDITDSAPGSPFTSNGFVKLSVSSDNSDNANNGLKRQIEVASFRAYTGSESNDPNLSIDAFSGQFGTDYLISKHRNNVLSMRNNVAVGAGALAFTEPEIPSVNRRNGILGVNTTHKDETSGAGGSWQHALLTYSQGAGTFLITDPYTSGRDLTSYSFTEGDKIEIVATHSLPSPNPVKVSAGLDDIIIGGTFDHKLASSSSGDSGTGSQWEITVSSTGATDKFTATYDGDSVLGATNMSTSPIDLAYGLWVKWNAVTGHTVSANWTWNMHHQTVEMGVYEVDSKPSATTLRVKGNPKRGPSGTIANACVAYRIVSKSHIPGVSIITSNSGLMDKTSANGLLHIADGSDRMYATNGDGSRLVGIRHPAVKPGDPTTLGYGDQHSGGALEVKFTYYDLFTATESIQSEASDPIGVDGFAADWSIKLIDAVTEGQSDSRATHVRWYTKNPGDPSRGTEFVRMNTIPLHLDDSNGDVIFNMGENYNNSFHLEKLDAVDNSLPPPASVLVWHRDRMWYCEDNSTKVFASAAGVPDYVDPTDFFHAGRADGQKVTALVSGKSLLLDQVTDVLVVLKERSLYTFTNTADLSSLKIDKVGEVGCGGVMAWAVDENGVLYFGGEHGIHMWRGGDVIDLHYAIQDTYFGYDLSNLDKMALAIDVQEGLLLVSLNTGNFNVNDKILVMNYRKPPVQGPRGVLYEWSIWNLAATSFVVDTEDGLPKLRFGTASGQIGTYRGDAGTVKTDNGTGITWNWNGPKLHLNTQLKKRWYYLGVDYEKQSTSSDILIGHRLNEESASTTKRVDQSEERRAIHRLARRGEYLMPTFSASVNSEVTRILGYDVSVEQVGRR